MKPIFASTGGLRHTVLATTLALVVCSPVLAADPAPTTSPAVAERAAAGETTPADNSARNVRDATGDKVTPLDQSGAESDVEVTRSIRKMLVDDDTLGTNAQNVKVITVDGVVTLRGPVANAEEQARIVAIAKEAAGVDRVLNELQVIKR